MMDGLLGQSPGAGPSEDAVQEEGRGIRYSCGGASASGTGEGKEGTGQARVNLDKLGSLRTVWGVVVWWGRGSAHGSLQSLLGSIHRTLLPQMK